MSPQEYECLLMALDLARMDKRWGFSIIVMKWKVFLEGYLFSTINCDGAFEVDTKKMDIDALIRGEGIEKISQRSPWQQLLSHQKKRQHAG